jgi:hypothetical protein
VIWNKLTREVVGSCRIGQIDIILKRFGHDGLASGATFHYSPLFLQETGPALEIGKVFIRREYRGDYAPAALLWKGIGYFVSYNPHYRALIAHASVNEGLSRLSRDLIVSFLKRNTFAPKPARLVAPVVQDAGGRSIPRVRHQKTHLANMGALSRIISEIEGGATGVPADMKHYVKLGGKLIGYNDRSPRKGGLNVLMLIDLMKCSRTLLCRSMGQAGMERFFDYHGGRGCRAA